MAGFEPLGVLVEHRIHNVNESFVAGEEPVAAGEQIAFEPALAHVLAQHFHDSAVRRNAIVRRQNLSRRNAVGDLEHGIEPVGRRLVRAHDAEVEGCEIELHDVPQELAGHAGGFGGGGARLGDRHRVAGEIGHGEIS